MTDNINKQTEKEIAKRAERLKQIEALKQSIRDREPIFSDSPSIMARLQRSISLFMIIVILLVIAGASWSVYGPSKLRYTDLPWKVQASVFHAGEKVPLIVHRCNYSHKLMFYEVTKALVNVKNNESYILGSTTLSVSPGCSTVISTIHRLPEILPPGTYILTGIANVPDVFNSKNVSYYSEPFNVVQ